MVRNIYTLELTAWGSILEKLIVTQLIKKFPTFNESVFRRGHPRHGEHTS
jgi:hypothetical protein